MAFLILVRHGKSTYNDQGLWAGWHDPELHEDGKRDAKNMAALIHDLEIHQTFTSKLKRAQDTLKIIKDELKLHHISTIEHEALNERHYGVFAGKNKWQVKEEVGEETFKKIRRSWDHPIPEGETMKDVFARVIPYFEEVILPELQAGKNVLIAAHGNSLRALVKYLESIDEEAIADLEVGLGEVRIYDIDETGNVTNKEIRGENLEKGEI